ncbi:MAG: hypothetical protein PUP92_17185 [Rhizonema sp. PD38]|nr:hypothetical protein [Rhizonema sp. PD38]
MQSKFGEFGWMLKVQTQLLQTIMNYKLRKPNSKSALELSIAQERLRQARHSFNLAFIATAASTFISLSGAGLLLSGKASEGAVTATGGIVASVRCVQLAKDCNDRLDKILAELEDED